MYSKYNTFFTIVKRKCIFWVALSPVFYAFFIPSPHTYFELVSPWGKTNALIYRESCDFLDDYASGKPVDSLQVVRVLQNHSIICSFSDTLLMNKLIAYKNNFRCPGNRKHKKGTIGIMFEHQNDRIIPYLYIITGKTYTPEILEKLQFKNQQEFLKQCLIYYLETIHKTNEIYRLNRFPKAFDTLYPVYKTQTDSIWNHCANNNLLNFKYNQTQIHDYVTVGGLPQLDGSRFWLIGEIYPDYEIIERIATTKTDMYFRGVKNAKIALKIL